MLIFLALQPLFKANHCMNFDVFFTLPEAELRANDEPIVCRSMVNSEKLFV
jgi:hypothetical protein